MILVVTGTHEPFVRLVSAAAAAAEALEPEKIWIQHGEAPLPTSVQGEAYVARGELLERMGRASVVVCHAGSGTILDALSCGHVPVVMPRLAKHGEHVNDHQLELTAALSAQERIVPVHQASELVPAIARARELTEQRRQGLVGEVGASLKQRIARDVRELGSLSSGRGGLASRLMAVASRWVPRRPGRSLGADRHSSSAP